MTAIFLREFKGYFNSMLGWVLTGVMLLFGGLYFTAVNLQGGYTDLNYTLYSFIIVLLIFVPLLCMRSFAEEKRSRTDQLLLTSPVSIPGIVMGKYLSLLAMFAVPLGVYVLYPLLMKALGAACVIGIRRTSKEKPDYLDEQYTMEELDSVLGRADIVAMVLPGGEATCHLMDERRLGLMKKGAYLVNVGRGNAIDPDALYRALISGQLAGCGLDVTEPEPLPAESPLWDLDQMLITPHVAGNFFLSETFERIVRIAGENLKAWANHEPFRNVVDLKAGY